MNGKFVHLLLAIAHSIALLGLTAAIIIRHASRLLFVVLLMAGFGFYAFRLFRAPRSASIWQMHRLSKIANAIYVVSAIGIMISAIFIAFHKVHTAHQLISVSLVLLIIGLLTGAFAPLRSNGNILNAIFVKRVVLLRNTIYLCLVCIMTGLLLRNNHYAYGKLLIYDGAAFLVVFLVIWEIYRQYIKKKNAS